MLSSFLTLMLHFGDEVQIVQFDIDIYIRILYNCFIKYVGVVFMARRARKTAENGLYHIYFKGNGNEKIFRCRDDCDKLLFFAGKLGERMEILAYGFNNADGHLFIKTFELSAVMKKLMTDYAMWFNKKYTRSGTLFGSRYKSEPIESRFAPGLARYIIQHGKFNSSAEFKSGAISSEILSHFNSVLEFSEFLKSPEEDTYGANSPYNTAAINYEAAAAFGGKSFLALSNDERVSAVLRLSGFGLSKSAIARLAGVSRGTVVRCLKVEQDNKTAEINRRNAEVVLL